MWGAVVGTVAVTAIGEVLLRLETGVQLAGYLVTIPDGTRGIVTALALVLMLIWRPRGLTGGRQFGFRRPSIRVKRSADK